VLLLDGGRIGQSGTPEEILGCWDFGKKQNVDLDDGQPQPSEKNETSTHGAEDALHAAAGPSSNEERRQRGRIAGKVITSYLSAAGTWLTLSVLLSLAFMQASRNAADVWLAKWISDTRRVR